MYTLTTFDQIIDELSKGKFTKDSFNTLQKNSNYNLVEVETIEDGRQRVTINTTGHNPKNITLEATEDEITIKATKEEGTSSFVKDVDLTLTLGTDYDGTKTDAKFENGLLTLLIDKKIERKSKTLKISY
jgi:HSP20 family molecular chaperone IbpA